MTIRGLNIKRTLNDTTYYVHDATGNVMGIYVKDDLTLTTLDRPIYGSSRLGILNKDVKSLPSAVRRLPSFFISLTDYYPFGYPISFRTHNSGYRYGFNGQEGDNEVYGDGKSYTAEYWQYDSRLGRRWNVDKNIEYYLSKYSCLQNNPINYIDLLGDSSVVDNKGYIIHYDPKDIDLRVFMQENNKLTLIGTLGKTIDANIWFKNLLIENSEKADNIWDPVTFRNYVTEMGIWDYKY